MKCFYHNDMDGRCAASIVAEYYENFDRENYIEVDYIQPLPLDIITKGELVLFVDYSFKSDTVWQLKEVLKKTQYVIWIDHHTSSIKLLKEQPELKDLTTGIIQDKISGAALTYMYFYRCEFEDCPEYIQLVSDYDCWIYKFGDRTTYFKLGLEAEPFDALDDIWKYLYNFPQDIESIINKGKIIKQFIDQDNEYYLSHFGYESKLLGHKCYVVNKKSNSWIFGDKINQYPFVVVWVFTGDKYSYSLFSTDPTVDCSKIAEQLGGGGHKGAAGFSSDTLLVKKVN